MKCQTRLLGAQEARDCVPSHGPEQKTDHDRDGVLGQKRKKTKKKKQGVLTDVERKREKDRERERERESVSE